MFIKSLLPIKDIPPNTYNDTIGSAKLMVADSMGPKVMRLDNGNIIKIFRHKRVFSSALIAPYAIRFSNHAFKLKALNIPTITPLELMYCPQKKTYVVEYQPLPGALLRGLLQASEDDTLFRLTASFIAELHNKGVYFRSLHFENIVCHENKLGLIDIADMKIHNRPLSPALRQRNFQHFLRYPADAKLINNFGLDKFTDLYQEHLRHS